MRLRSVGVLAVPIGCGVLLYGNADPFLERPRCDSVRLAPVALDTSTVSSTAITNDDDLPLLSVDELRTHASEESCWVCLDGVVYDVTEFSRSHPGGTEALGWCWWSGHHGILEQVPSSLRLGRSAHCSRQLPKGWSAV